MKRWQLSALFVCATWGLLVGANYLKFKRRKRIQLIGMAWKTGFLDIVELVLSYQ